MAFTMDAAVVRSYENAAIMLVQQMVSRMRDKVRLVTGLNSTSHSFTRHGVQSLAENAVRNGDTSYTDTPWTRRVVGPRRFNGAELLDKLDMLQMGQDPTTLVQQGFRAAAGRTIDDIIFAAALGTARTGVDGAGSETFPAGQVIAVDEHDLDHETAAIYTSSNVPMTIGKMSAAIAKIQINEGDSYDAGGMPPICVSLSASQLAALRRQVPYTNDQYMTKQLIDVINGASNVFMGAQVVRTQRNLVDGSGYERCIVWHRDAIGLAVWEDVDAKLEQIATKNYSWQAWIELVMNAVRIESERVVEVKCTIPSF